MSDTAATIHPEPGPLPAPARRGRREEGAEEFALHYAPLNERLPRSSVTPAYWALVGSLVFLIFGALVALTIGTVNAIIALVISVVLQGGLYYFLAGYSIRSGVTTAVFSRTMFGTAGSGLAALLLGAVAIFYGALESSIIAIAFDSYVGGLSLKVWYLVVAVYSVIFAIGGIRNWLDRINWILLPLYGVGLAVAVVWTGAKYGFDAGGWASHKPEAITVPGPPILFGVVTYMGVMILVMFSWDYSRVARTRDTAYHRWVTFGPVYYFLTYLVNGIIGIFIVFAIPSELAPSEASLVFNLLALMGVAGLIFIWVSQTRINTANFYVAALCIESLALRVARLRVPRWAAAVIAGAIVFALELGDVFSFLGDALQYQAVLVVAWVGLATAHVAESQLRRRRGDVAGARMLDDWRPGRVRTWNVGGLVVWFVAAGAGLLLLKVVEGTWGAWSAPITFLLSTGGYWLWLRSPMHERMFLRRRNDVRTTVPDEFTSELVCGYCSSAFAAHEMDITRDDRIICAECADENRAFRLEAIEEDRELRAAARS
jgi:purine-cytosine permease-like protein